MFHFKLKPKINEMKRFVKKIIDIKVDLFPFGKSMFVFTGKEDTLYFIIFKETDDISVIEVFDDVLNRIPARYQILPRIDFKEVLVRA